LEYDVATERWKDYNDPDGETEMVLFKDQGLIHEITTSVSYVDKIVWAATYFGASRYDGRGWHNFLQKDSGLPSNFMNFIKGVDANRAWFCTDKGLAYYDERIGQCIGQRSIRVGRRCWCAMRRGTHRPLRRTRRRRITTSWRSISRGTMSGWRRQRV
jgi:hypothetical protein